ncbi:MAG: KilA-N domain-containing protein [Bacteroidota bacterium]
MAGLNRFILSPKQWITSTEAVGFIVKSGRYGGGTFAVQDIAFEFCSWLSPEFKLYLIKEFQRLKEVEAAQNSLDWNLQRTISKINYRIHTVAVKDNLIPPIVNRDKIAIIYATEADLLNVALFGMTAKEWRELNPDKQGNVRDHARIEHLVVLSNLESLNAMLISNEITSRSKGPVSGVI